MRKIIIIAIGIYAIVFGVLCPGQLLFSSLSGAKVDVAEIQIQHFHAALSRLNQDLGRYPTTAEGLPALLNCLPSLQCQLWDGPYMTTLPYDPWNVPYRYQSDLKSNPPQIYSSGRDRISHSNGNDIDDINSWDEQQKWRQQYASHFPYQYNDWRCQLLFSFFLMVLLYLMLPKIKSEIERLRSK